MWNAEVFPGGFGDVPSIFRRHGNSRMTNSNSTVETLHVNHLPVARNYVFSHSWCLYGISCFNNEDAAENSTRNKVQPISLTPIVFATPGNFLRAWFFHSFSTAPCFLLQRSALPRFVVADLSDTISLPHFPNYHGKFILRNLPCAKEGGSEASEFRSVFLLQLLLHILGDTTFPEEFGIPTVSAVLVRKDTVEVLIDQVRDQTGIQKGTRFLEELVCDVRSNPNTSFWRPDRKEASKRAKRMAKLGRVSDSVPSAANHTFNVLGGAIHIEYVTSHPQPICVESKTSEASNLDTSSIAGPSEAGSMEWKSEMKQNSMPQKNKQRKKTSRADVQHSVTKTPPTTSSGSTQPIEDAPLHLGRDSKVPEKVAIDDTSACNEVLTNARKDPPPVTDGPSCSTPPLKFEQKGKKKEFSARIKVTQEQHSEKSNQMPTNVTPLSQSAISAPFSAQAGTTETPSLPGRSQRPSLTSATPITPSEVEAVHPSKASCDEKLSPSENVHHKAVSQKVVTGTNSVPPTGLNSLTTTKKRNSNLRYDEKATKSNRGSRLKVTRCVPEEQLSACAESQSKKRIAISVAMLAAVLLSLIFNFL